MALLTIVTFMLSIGACGKHHNNTLRHRKLGPTVRITKNPEKIQEELSSSLTLVEVTATPSAGKNITRVELHLNRKLACYKESGDLEVVRFGPYDHSCGPMMVLGNGDHEIMAKARDSDGKWTSTTMDITINAGSCQPTGLYSNINHMWAHYVQENFKKLAIREYEWEESPYKSRLDYYATDDQELNWFVFKLEEGDCAYNTTARSPRLEVYNSQYKYPMDPGSGVWEFSANIAGYQLCGNGNCGNNILIFQIYSRFDDWTVSMYVRRNATEGVRFKDRGGDYVKIADHGETFHFKISVDWDANTYSIFVNCQEVLGWQNKPLWNPQYGGYIFRFGSYGQTTSRMLAPARIHYSGVKMIKNGTTLGSQAIRPFIAHKPAVNNQTQSTLVTAESQLLRGRGDEVVASITTTTTSNLKEEEEADPTTMPNLSPTGGPAGGGFIWDIFHRGIRDTSNRGKVRLHSELKLILEEGDFATTLADILTDTAAITILQEVTGSVLNQFFQRTTDPAFVGRNPKFSMDNVHVAAEAELSATEYPIKFVSQVEMDFLNEEDGTNTSAAAKDIQRLETNGHLLNEYLKQLKMASPVNYGHVERVVLRVIRRHGGGQ